VVSGGKDHDKDLLHVTSRLSSGADPPFEIPFFDIAIILSPAMARSCQLLTLT